jgi:HTH-type transcriptional regulator/antitoxin HigA
LAVFSELNGLFETLLDEAQGEEKHPAMGLVDIVGDLIEDYEAKQHPLPEVTGVQALKFLMEQHGLKQSELTEIGSQGVVSEILTGKRELNIRQVRALSERFGVSAATFV